MKKRLTSGRITIDQPEIGLRIERDNFKRLDEKDTRTHLDILRRMLHLMSRVVYEKMHDTIGENTQLQHFLLRLGDTLEAIVLKNRKHGEADKIFTLYSKKKGKITAIAKGVRKVSSRRGGNLDTLNHVVLGVNEGKGDFKYITEVQSKKNV